MLISWRSVFQERAWKRWVKRDDFSEWACCRTKRSDHSLRHRFSCRSGAILGSRGAALHKELLHFHCSLASCASPPTRRLHSAALLTWPPCTTWFQCWLASSSCWRERLRKQLVSTCCVVPAQSSHTLPTSTSYIYPCHGCCSHTDLHMTPNEFVVRHSRDPTHTDRHMVHERQAVLLQSVREGILQH